MRKYWIVLLLSLMVAAACGDSDGDADDPTNAPADGALAFEGEVLRVGIFSQQSADLLQEGFGNAFEAATGASVQWVVANTDVNVSKILASPDNPEVDTMIVSNHDVWPLVNAGLVVEPDYENMPNIENVVANARLDSGPGLWFFDLGICYNTERYAEAGLAPPQSIEDLFDPALRGHIALPDSASGFFNQITIPLAQHWGLSTTDPAGFVERMSQLEPAGFFNSNSDATNLFQSDTNVWAGIFSARCLVWKNTDGLPFEYVPINLDIDGQVFPHVAYIVGVSNVKGGNPELGEIFMNFAISEDGVGPFLRQITFTPVVEPVLQDLLADPAKAPIIHDNPSSDIYVPDYADFWLNKSDWVNAWNRAFR